MTTISMSMNRDSQIEFCTKYHCTTDQIGRVIKASVTDAKHSPYWRPLEGNIAAGDLITKLKRSETYDTSDETKEILYTIFGSYVETLKEFLKDKPHLRERVLES
jgi:hypothetical protein